MSRFEIRKKYRKWKMRDILQWRTDLSEYELDFLVPELKGRTEALLDYFTSIERYCEERVDEKTFGSILRELVIDSKLEQLVHPSLRPPTPEVMAKSYFDDIKNMNRATFIDPLNEVLALFKDNMTLKEFGTLLTKLNFVCSTVIQVKNKLFLYSMRSYAVSYDDKGVAQLKPPMNITVLLMPFENTIENVLGVANSTSENILGWHSEQKKQKTEFLSLLSQRIAQRNNLLTIIVAIVLSWLFLTLSSPYDKMRLESEYDKMSKLLNKTTQHNAFLINENIEKERSWNKRIKELEEELIRVKK